MNRCVGTVQSSREAAQCNTPEATTYLWIIIFNASLLLNLTKLVRIYHFVRISFQRSLERLPLKLRPADSPPHHQVRLPDPLWLMWDNGVLRELRPRFCHQLPLPSSLCKEVGGIAQAAIASLLVIALGRAPSRTPTVQEKEPSQDAVQVGCLLAWGGGYREVS